MAIAITISVAAIAFILFIIWEMIHAPIIDDPDRSIASFGVFTDVDDEEDETNG